MQCWTLPSTCSLRAWWRFAIDSVLHRIRERNERSSIGFALKRAQQNVTYVREYTQHLTQVCSDDRYFFSFCCIAIDPFFSITNYGGVGVKGRHKIKNQVRSLTCPTAIVYSNYCPFLTQIISHFVILEK